MTFHILIIKRYKLDLFLLVSGCAEIKYDKKGNEWTLRSHPHPEESRHTGETSMLEDCLNQKRKFTSYIIYLFGGGGGSLIRKREKPYPYSYVFFFRTIEGRHCQRIQGAFERA